MSYTLLRTGHFTKMFKRIPRLIEQLDGLRAREAGTDTHNRDHYFHGARQHKPYRYYPTQLDRYEVQVVPTSTLLQPHQPVQRPDGQVTNSAHPTETHSDRGARMAWFFLWPTANRNPRPRWELHESECTQRRQSSIWLSLDNETRAPYETEYQEHPCRQTLRIHSTTRSRTGFGHSSRRGRRHCPHCDERNGLA